MKTPSHNFSKYVTLATFGLVVWLPIMQMVTGIFHAPPINENRYRVPKPSLSMVSRPGLFIGQTGLWFNDNYGLRDFFICTKTQFDFSVYGLSDRIYVGRNGWLFYRNELDVEKTRELAMTDAELDATIISLGQLRDYLRQRHITLIVMTNQLKDKFYQEDVPANAPRYGEHQRFDDFRARLQRLPGIIYIDTTPILQDLKKKRAIFHKTDFHWNDPAGYEVARILVDTLARREGRPIPYWRIPVKIQTRDFSGGQAMEIPLFHPLHEQGLFSVPTMSPMIRQTGPQPFAWNEKPADPNAACLGSMTAYGDSFFDAMVRSGLSCHFQEICLAGYNYAPLSKVLSAMPNDTKYFIYQFIELSLPKVADHINEALPSAASSN